MVFGVAAGLLVFCVMARYRRSTTHSSNRTPPQAAPPQKKTTSGEQLSPLANQRNFSSSTEEYPETRHPVPNKLEISTGNNNVRNLPSHNEYTLAQTKVRADIIPSNACSLASVSGLYDITPEFKSVLLNIRKEAPFILVTGGAGTGKTTLIRMLRDSFPELMGHCVILAPTGASALVCKGKTIHSFFRLKPGMQLEDTWESNDADSFTAVCRSLKLIIIDEISMVRSDLMDAIDRRMRESRENSMPFGGVPILMVGDPCQLPPIVIDDEKKFFASELPKQARNKARWKSPWFFHAHVFDNQKFSHIKLTHVFRQHEDMKEYIRNLNKLRVFAARYGNIESAISYFNKHCFYGCSERDKSAIYITFTRYVANSINRSKLESLPGPEYVFHAKVAGVFQFADGKSNPAEVSLVLKEGAHVMLLVNDTEKHYVNGSLGVIKKIYPERVIIQLHNGFEADVGRHTWESYNYVYNDATKRIEQVIDGTFTQLPVALAWAFTAHKSQGKTLDKVNVILQGDAFAAGQTYVALSRTRGILDIQLSRPLTPFHFITDESLYELTQYINSEDDRPFE